MPTAEEQGHAHHLSERKKGPVRRVWSDDGDREDMVSLAEVREQLDLNARLLQEMSEKRAAARRNTVLRQWMAWKNRLTGCEPGPLRRHVTASYTDSDTDRLTYAMNDSNHALERVTSALVDMRKKYEGEAIEKDLAGVGLKTASLDEAIFWEEGRYAPLVGMIESLRRQVVEEKSGRADLQHQCQGLERKLHATQKESGAVMTELHRQMDEGRRQLHDTERALSKAEDDRRKLKAELEQKDIALAFERDAKRQAERLVVSLGEKLQHAIQEKEALRTPTPTKQFAKLSDRVPWKDNTTSRFSEQLSRIKAGNKGFMSTATVKRVMQEKEEAVRGRRHLEEEFHLLQGAHQHLVECMSALAGECDMLKQALTSAEEEKNELMARLEQSANTLGLSDEGVAKEVHNLKKTVELDAAIPSPRAVPCLDQKDDSWPDLIVTTGTKGSTEQEQRLADITKVQQLLRDNAHGEGPLVLEQSKIPASRPTSWSSVATTVARFSLPRTRTLPATACAAEPVKDGIATMQPPEHGSRVETFEPFPGSPNRLPSPLAAPDVVICLDEQEREKALEDQAATDAANMQQKAPLTEKFMDEINGANLDWAVQW